MLLLQWSFWDTRLVLMGCVHYSQKCQSYKITRSPLVSRNCKPSWAWAIFIIDIYQWLQLIWLHCIRSLPESPQTFLWNADQQSAFNHTKQALAEAAILCYPQLGAPLVLTTDASDIAIGAVLETIFSNVPQPLSFYSRTLHKTERNYSTFDKELLAVHSAIRHFRHMLEGSQFTIQTDHRPLVTALTKSGDAWSARQQRQLSAIAESGGTITYIPGSKKPVPDALSPGFILL